MKTMVYIVIIAAVLLLLVVPALRAQNSGKQGGLLEEQIKNGAFLLDVRTPQEFAEGHVEGSLNIPLGDLEQRLDELKDKKEKTIVVFCKSGKRAEAALGILKSNGFTDVTNGGGWATIHAVVEKQKNQ